MNNKQALAFLSSQDLRAQFKEKLPHYPAFRSAQIFEWVCKGVLSFSEMDNLPVPMRKELSQSFAFPTGNPVSELRDRDGTLKLGIKLDDGALIEAVALRDGKGRRTACLSVQAGCPLACVFCKTGSLGLKRNLSAFEISGQFLHLRAREKEISHIVIMGMGEALLNLDELKKALVFFMDEKGINISKRRITISTSGITEGIIDLANNGPDIRLALSLTTARAELRQGLMPLSCRENSLPKVKEALLEYQKKRKRRITLEMVLLGGINTSAADAKAAKEFAKGLDTVMNLIPWNPVEALQFNGIPLRVPAQKEIFDFAAALENEGLKVTIRMEKGKSISGACGQLGSI